MSAPIPHTCPLIDGAIRKLQEAEKKSEEIKDYFDELSPNYIKESLSNVIDILSSLYVNGNSDLEGIRDANSELRKWGESQEERADDAEYEVRELESKLKELQ